MFLVHRIFFYMSASSASVSSELKALYKSVIIIIMLFLFFGSDALRTLHKIVTQVWKEKVVPEEWHQSIIIPLYKGKGSTSECSNYRGITLLSAPGKVFAHIILARIKPTLLSHRRTQQSGFTPGRSACDRIAILCNKYCTTGIQLLQHLLTSVLHLTLLADPRCGYS